MLLEDETDRNSQALVANLALILEASLSDVQKKMQMSITEVKMFKCRANLVERTYILYESRKTTTTFSLSLFSLSSDSVML